MTRPRALMHLFHNAALSAPATTLTQARTDIPHAAVCLPEAVGDDVRATSAPMRDPQRDICPASPIQQYHRFTSPMTTPSHTLSTPASEHFHA